MLNSDSSSFLSNLISSSLIVVNLPSSEING